MWGEGSRTSSPPSQGSPPSPDTCLPGWRWRVQTGKAERRPTPARLHGPMASQDVEGKLTRKAGREALPTGPPQDWLPEPDRGRGSVQWAKLPVQGAPLAHCSSPDGSLDCSMPILRPADGVVHLSAPPAKESKRHKPQGRPEMRWPAQGSRWAKENQSRW